MMLADWLVAGREAVLNRVLGVDTDQVLNDAPLPATAAAGGPEIAGEIKRAINAFKATAVDAGGRRVDYARLRESVAYATYREECTPKLAALDPGSLETHQERLAFWINLYNALVIDGVITFGVERSVTEGFAGTLAFFRRAAYDVGGRRVSCDDIEHGVLRSNRGHPYVPGPQFGPSDPRRDWAISPLDPRIHFALNCASRSCPPVGVYAANNMDAQLDLATANFVRGEVEISPVQGELRLSQIFRWYAGDFGGRRGVIEFLLRHLPAGQDREWLTAHRDDVALIHQPYDWTLNTQLG